MSNVIQIDGVRSKPKPKQPAPANPLTAEECDRAQCLLDSASARLRHACELVFDVEDDYETWSRMETALEWICNDLEAVIELLEGRSLRADTLAGHLCYALAGVQFAETAAGHPCIFVGHECGLDALLKSTAATLEQAQQLFIPLAVDVRTPS